MKACVLIRSDDTYEGKQGLAYFQGISAQSAESDALCLHKLVIPPGGRAKAHLHEAHESAIFVLSGEAEMWHGERLENHWSAGQAILSTSPPAFLTYPRT